MGGQEGDRHSWTEEDKISDSEWRHRWMITQKDHGLSSRRDAGCSFGRQRHRWMVRVEVESDGGEIRGLRLCGVRDR